MPSRAKVKRCAESLQRHFPSVAGYYCFRNQKTFSVQRGPARLARGASHPGCGSQRLLRPLVRASHPAGRGPNSSSLFPPLAAVVAVAPRGGAAGVSVRSEQDERSSDWSKTIVPRYRGQRSTSFCDMRNLSGQLRVARLANGSPFGRTGAPAPERAISASR